MKKTLLLVFIHGFKSLSWQLYSFPSIPSPNVSSFMRCAIHANHDLVINWLTRSARRLYQGGEETFGHKYAFTQHLRDLVSDLLPNLDVRVLVYPKYETRGDLADCVSRFRDWLQEKVIDIEVGKGTPSPTVEPSVRAVLCGHSMGGIVAAEAVIALTSERVIPPSTASGGAGDGNHTAAPGEREDVTLNGLMFPYVQGVLSFDTPYLGISPGVVAHGAESHYGTASAALSQLSTLTSLWNSGKAATVAKEAGAAGPSETKPALAALPAPPPEGGISGSGVGNRPRARASSSAWGSWGRMAMYAGAGAALAGGAAAAYLKRDQLTEGWTWVSSHLEFVGCLARGEELRRRIAYMARVDEELGVGFGNLYTRLGRGAVAVQQQQQQGPGGGGGANLVGTVMGSQRTFCNLPSRRAGPNRSGVWEEATNEAAADETSAHMAMFEPAKNPGYEKLSSDAAELIAKWTRNDWYESSFDSFGAIEDTPADERYGRMEEDTKENASD
ncbi:hypothetical protein VPNG_03868 [Cytospora leucostoma]|uniref:DUF676 domain-containing protein n=1 Tax=Cytospora leucostoma TaxID=1230097 RepID=A0A423XE89_9PEZI|nr:hypothetical protein VPNG_03868 [Cytospora leucostoma]